MAISNWTKEAFGVGGFGFHDHWKIPHLNHPPAETPEESNAAFQAWAEGRGEDPTMMGYDDEEQTLLLALTPKQKRGVPALSHGVPCIAHLLLIRSP